jgi:multidrug resistance efflux pump
VQNSRASKADVQALRTALDTAEAALLRSTRELEEQQTLITEFQLDARNQQQLERARSSNELDQLKADLARERQELGFAERDLARQEQLFRAGAVAQNVVDRARTSVETNREQMRALQARIRAQTNRVEAADRNLNLDRTRSGTDPLPRLQDARLRLAQLKGEHDAAERRVKGLEAQLETANTLYKQDSDVWLDAPIEAVIWRVLARVGDTLRVDQPVLKLVNCRTRWVNTYVSEADLKRLTIGSRARIDLIGEELDLRGKVDLIRSGVGRVSGSSDEPVPLPINLARQSQVRVRIDSDVPAPPRKLCFVGYSARVIFL